MNTTAQRGGVSIKKMVELKKEGIKVLSVGVLGTNIMNHIIETRTDMDGMTKYIIRSGGKWIAVDNETGDAWTEEFNFWNGAMDWLKGVEEMEEVTIHENAGTYSLTREDIRAYIQELAQSQGSYTRLNASIEAMEEELIAQYSELMKQLEKEGFKSPVDLILYIEC